MSDPMTNAEVEDVLSSIRRLVSDDKPEEPAQQGVSAPDRLVLTPSLRVPEPPEPEADDTEVAAPESVLPDNDPTALTEFITERHSAPSSAAPAEVEGLDAVEAHRQKVADLWVDPNVLPKFVMRGDAFGIGDPLVY